MKWLTMNIVCKQFRQCIADIFLSPTTRVCCVPPARQHTHHIRQPHTAAVALCGVIEVACVPHAGIMEPPSRRDAARVYAASGACDTGVCVTAYATRAYVIRPYEQPPTAPASQSPPSTYTGPPWPCRWN